MGVPVLILGERLVNAVIEVLVVGEDNVATDVVQLPRRSIHVLVLAGSPTEPLGITHEALRGHVGGSKTTGSLVGVDDQPRRTILSNWLAGRVFSSYPSTAPLIFFSAPHHHRIKTRTIWLRRLAAPKPVGPAPMTRTSTELKRLLVLSLSNWRRATRGKGPYMSGWVILP